MHLPHRSLSHLLRLCLWWNIWYSQIFVKNLMCVNLKLFSHFKLHAFFSFPSPTWFNTCLVYLWHLFLEIVLFSSHVTPVSGSCLSYAVTWVKCVQNGMKTSQSHQILS
jgi:hypothetical protein